MGGMGLIFTPVLVRNLLRPSSLVWAYDLTLLGLMATPNSPIGWCNPPAASHPPPPPPHPLICAIHDITVVLKRLLKIQQC